MNEEQKAKYKNEMSNILAWGGTKEEQLSAFIQLVEELLEA